MIIQKNSRQIPKQNEIVGNKDYCDLVYSWFQYHSEVEVVEGKVLENAVRYVLNSDINYSAMGKELGMDRRTAGRYVEALYKQGLLVRENEKTILKNLDKTVATLVPCPTLRQIMNSLHRNSVSIFGYLLNRYIANVEEPYFITYNELKRYVGISTATSSNNIVVSDILKTLAGLKLIQYQVVQTTPTKCNIQIQKVTNVLPK